MKNISKFSLALAMALVFSGASSRGQAPLRNHESDLAPLVLAQISDVSGNTPASPATLLYFSRRCHAGDPLAPIIAPDGHQVTWGEWTDVQGQAAIKCVYQGSHVVVHFSGLIPNGQY